MTPSESTLPTDLRAVARSMHNQFDERLGADVVDTELQRCAADFADARVRLYVPLLVRRYALHGLRERSGEHRRTPLTRANAD